MAFDTLHLDLFETIFDYLTQQELIDYLTISRLFQQQITKYIDNTTFFRIVLNKELKRAFLNNLIISIKRLDIHDIDWNWALYGACESGNMKLLKYAIKNGAYDFYEGSYQVCLHGYLELFNYLRPLLKTGDEIDLWFEAACESGNYQIINELIKLGAKNWNRGLEGACCGGHYDIAEWMIKLGAYDWNTGFAQACRGGHIKIVELMIEKGVYYTADGLYWACYKGNESLVKYLIDKGINSWNKGLQGACFTKNLTLIKLMIEKGADCCYACGKPLGEHLKIK